MYGIGSHVLCSCTEGLSVGYVRIPGFDALNLFPAHQQTCQCHCHPPLLQRFHHQSHRYACVVDS